MTPKVDNEDCDGHYDDETLLITIAKNKTPEYTMAILLHEIGHAIFHAAGLHETTIGDNLEEIIVEQYAKVLVKNFIIKPK